MISKDIIMIVICLIIVLILLIQFIQLQYSCFRKFIKNKIVFIKLLFNILLLCIPTFFILVFVNNLMIALLISSLMLTIWSIINIYVVLYRGSPLLLHEIRNIKTALNVISRYRFTLDRNTIITLLLLFCEIGLICLLNHISLLSKLSLVADNSLISLCIFVIILFVDLIIFKVRNRLGLHVKGDWFWTTSIKNNGYLIHCIYTFKKYYLMDKNLERYKNINISIPQVEDLKKCYEPTDVILILNESLFDLEEYLSIENESNCLQEIKLLPNITMGKAIVLVNGTNDSEFELLTGNSTKLVKPFPYNYIDFTKHSLANAVSFFNDLRLHTSSLHWADPSNYCRKTVYKQMGFDELILGKEQYKYHSRNGKRSHLDIDDYHQLIDIYERNNTSSQFIFCVTYQNHGGYNMNSEDMNTVRITKDFGKLTHEVNEYLSSVKLSSEAFKELTDYFSKKDKRVIICMVGDHKPAFVDQLPIDKYESEDAAQIAKRLVPYYIWSNFKYETPENHAYASITDLLPMTIKASGLPLSPWYQQILNLHKVAPARYFNDTYLDKDGNLCKFKDSNIAEKELLNYYAMASNNIRGGKDFREDIFKPIQF